jgi:hypothetical protein
VVIIGGAVGGGVGGSLAAKNSSNAPALQTSASAIPAVSSTSSASGTSSTGSATPTPTGAIIEERVYRLTNVAAGTAIDLLQGNSSNGTYVTGW